MSFFLSLFVFPPLRFHSRLKLFPAEKGWMRVVAQQNCKWPYRVACKQQNWFSLFLTSRACKEGSFRARPKGWLSWCPVPRPVAKSNLCRGWLETGKEEMLVMGSDASRVGAVKRLASSPLRCKWCGRRRLIIIDQILARCCWVCGVNGRTPLHFLLKLFWWECWLGTR